MLEWKALLTCRYFSKPKQDIQAAQHDQAQECVVQIAELKRISEVASREIRGVETEITEFLRENRDFAQNFLAQST